MLEHGGKLREAAHRFGHPQEGWIDLSTGLNPHGYPAPSLPADAWQRLPEVDPALAAAACLYYGAPAMLAVAGTQAAIAALPTLRAPSRVVVASPSYAEHAYHWGLHGHALREVPYESLAAQVDDCDVMVVCNPNNPTGFTLPPAQLRDWAARLAERGGWLVVDEAFGDCAPQLSVAASCTAPGLIVLRSIGKFFGLAGARVGFVGAQAALLARLEDQLGPWTISGPAQLIARAALADHAWHTRERMRLDADGARMRMLLARHGIAAAGTPLFHWWQEERPEAFHHHMAERGIWVRLFSRAARGIRIGLPANDNEWTRLQTALNEWSDKPC